MRDATKGGLRCTAWTGSSFYGNLATGAYCFCRLIAGRGHHYPLRGTHALPFNRRERGRLATWLRFFCRCPLWVQLAAQHWTADAHTSFVPPVLLRALVHSAPFVPHRACSAETPSTRVRARRTSAPTYRVKGAAVRAAGRPWDLPSPACTGLSPAAPLHSVCWCLLNLYLHATTHMPTTPPPLHTRSAAATPVPLLWPPILPTACLLPLPSTYQRAGSTAARTSPDGGYTATHHSWLRTWTAGHAHYGARSTARATPTRITPLRRCCHQLPAKAGVGGRTPHGLLFVPCAATLAGLVAWRGMGTAGRSPPAQPAAAKHVFSCQYAAFAWPRTCCSFLPVGTFHCPTRHARTAARRCATL